MESIADQIEALIDQTSLSEVIQAVYEVCHEKAAHVKSTWQDKPLAREWSKAAVTLEKAAAKISL